MANAALKPVTPEPAASQSCGAMMEEMLRGIAQETVEQAGSLITREEVAAMVAEEVAKLAAQVGSVQQKTYRAATVAKMMDVSMGTVWNYAKKGMLPTPIKLSEGMVVFDSEEVHAAIDKIIGRN